MTIDDVAMNKAAVIERCIARVREEHAGDDARLDDVTRLDAVVLNLQRACEAAIDLAMHRVRVARLGVPQESREAFAALARAGRLEPALAETLKRMVGFRNIAVHDYQALSLEVVRRVVASHLDDLARFAVESVREAAERERG
jgi:uncharacterized protein YutE (UPF0331/DUF86 family)